MNADDIRRFIDQAITSRSQVHFYVRKLLQIDSLKSLTALCLNLEESRLFDGENLENLRRFRRGLEVAAGLREA